ncbi:MAG TPA: response regulator transcription factor [Acidimicrobiales bacterium]|nr:response regulator transcription factor [Acidimicrobiales bacterium]
MTTAVRVVVIDDQELVRTGFRMILDVEEGIEVVGVAGDGNEAVELCRTTGADVALMDIRMPRVGGIEATRRLRDAGLGTKVLVLTTFDLDEYVFDALRAGASGFLLKDAPPDDLVHAVRVIAAGEALLAPSITRRLIERFGEGGTPVPAPADDERLDRLTERERGVLVLMARGLSNTEIAEHLFLGEATVKTHVGRVLMKLDVRDRVQAVVLAYELGVVTPGA